MDAPAALLRAGRAGHLLMTTTATLADVKRYWSTHVNDIEVIQAPIGSRRVPRGAGAVSLREDAVPAGIVTSASLKGKHILEVGCGPGVDLVHLAAVGGRVTAVDLTPEAVSLARRHLEVRGLAGHRPGGQRRAAALRRRNIRRRVFARGTASYGRHAGCHRRSLAGVEARRRSDHHALPSALVVLVALEGVANAGRARRRRRADRARLLYSRRSGVSSIALLGSPSARNASL